MDGIRTRTHTHTQRHGHMPPGGVIDSCILQSHPAGSTVSQPVLWALIGQSVLSGVTTANRETLSWRAASNLPRFARYSHPRRAGCRLTASQP